MGNQGWIKLHRQLQDCWIWDGREPFDKRSAWIDLLLFCNHSDKKILFDGELIVVKRGQYLTSVRKLSDRWKWSKDKCFKFLQILETDGMIIKNSDSRRTLITIVNYGIYQDCQDSNKDSNKDSNETVARHSQATNNNDNNVKNDNNIIMSKQSNTELIKEIVAYLNEKTGKNYRHTTENTKKHINARLNEKYTLDDFKAVIDKKVAEWKDDCKMSNYLRPDTLFGTKFESYLNQDDDKNKKPKENKSKFNNLQERNYDFEDLERAILLKQ